MTNKESRIKQILSIFEQMYGLKKICYLNHSNPFELLIATILSAQSTDKRVNLVTENLFNKYKSVDDFAEADINELSLDIKPVGLAKSKSTNIIKASIIIRDKFNGKVPDNMEELLMLPGVGRKTANVILGNIYNIPGIVVDTHVLRISKRLGIGNSNSPIKMERELMLNLPKEFWIIYNIWLITFGRTICRARSPKCHECRLTKYCSFYKDRG